MIASLLSFVLLKLIIGPLIAIAISGVGAETLQGHVVPGFELTSLQFHGLLAPVGNATAHR